MNRLISLSNEGAVGATTTPMGPSAFRASRWAPPGRPRPLQGRSGIPRAG